MPLPGIAPIKKGGEAASLPLNLEPNESKVKRTNHVNDCFLPLISSFLSSSHSLSYRLCPIRPFGAPSPRGEGCDTRIPSSKKTARHPCEPIRSPSTVIPSEAEGSFLHDGIHRSSVCKEDFSTSLEMTIRQERLVFRRGVLATSKPISRLHMLPCHSVRRRQETDFPSPFLLPSPVHHGQACGPHRGSHS